MINPMVVEGQIFGGVVQGIGGVLLEDFVYDDDGNPLTTTFMDYLPPTTTEVPDIEVGHIETESTTNPGGYKGMGEGGAIGAHAAVANAVADALRPLGVKATKTPLGPEQIFALVEAAKACGLSIGVERDGAVVTVTLDRPESSTRSTSSTSSRSATRCARSPTTHRCAWWCSPAPGAGSAPAATSPSMTGEGRGSSASRVDLRSIMEVVRAAARHARDHRRRGQRPVRGRGALVRVRVRPALRRPLGGVRDARSCASAARATTGARGC